VGLEDLLETGVRELSVSDQDPETARVEERLVAPRDAVEDPSTADGVVGTLPRTAEELCAERDRTIDVGELVGFDIGAGEARSEKEPPVGCHLLLEVRGQSPAAPVAADGGDVRGLSRQLRQPDCRRVGAHATAAEPRRDRHLARRAPEVEPVLDLSDELKLTE